MDTCSYAVYVNYNLWTAAFTVSEKKNWWLAWINGTIYVLQLSIFHASVVYQCWILYHLAALGLCLLADTGYVLVVLISHPSEGRRLEWPECINRLAVAEVAQSGTGWTWDPQFQYSITWINTLHIKLVKLTAHVSMLCRADKHVRYEGRDMARDLLAGL